MAKVAAARRLKLWPGYQFIVSVWFPKVESKTEFLTYSAFSMGWILLGRLFDLTVKGKSQSK